MTMQPIMQVFLGFGVLSRMHSHITYKTALRRILDGKSYEEIHEELGVAVRTLALWRKQSGLKPLKSGPKGRKHHFGIVKVN